MSDIYEDIARNLARSLPPSDFGSTRAIQAVARLLREVDNRSDNVRARLAAAEAALVSERRRADEAVEALKDAAAHLSGAASAYREHAARHRSVGRAKTDAVFTTRASDFDKAASRARGAFASLDGEA